MYAPTGERLIRIAIALLSAALMLLGCNEQSRTLVAMETSIDGARVNDTRATIVDGLAEFQCKSAGGDCHYLLFVCPTAGSKPGALDAACAAKPVEEFALAAGQSKQIAGLPEGFRFCVGHGIKPVAPDCLE